MMVPAVVTASKAGATVVACIGLDIYRGALFLFRYRRCILLNRMPMTLAGAHHRSYYRIWHRLHHQFTFLS